MEKNTIIALVSLVAVGAAAYLLMPERLVNNINTEVVEVTSFDECKEAGYPVMESYPEQCITPLGKTFTNDINSNPTDNPATSTPSNPTGGNPPTNPDEGIACTMDAMQCPDGSWVGRSGPNCQFVCPGQ